jgi:hypothetical protein
MIILIPELVCQRFTPASRSLLRKINQIAARGCCWDLYSHLCQKSPFDKNCILAIWVELDYISTLILWMEMLPGLLVSKVIG